MNEAQSLTLGFLDACWVIDIFCLGGNKNVLGFKQIGHLK
jgi:hypothetical protein